MHLGDIVIAGAGCVLPAAYNPFLTGAVGLPGFSFRGVLCCAHGLHLNDREPFIIRAEECLCDLCHASYKTT